MSDHAIADIGSRFRCITASSVPTVMSTSKSTSQKVMSGQKVLTNIDLLRKGGLEGAIDALKGLIR